MKGKNSFFGILLVLIFSSQLFAVDYYYVDPAGINNAAHGSGPGTAAWRTIQYAVDNVESPDANDIVIYISADTYTLWDDLNTNTISIGEVQDLTLQGAGAEHTIIQGHTEQGSANGRVFKIESDWGNVSLRDMTIRYGNTSNEGGAIDIENNTILSIIDCNICYNHADTRGGAIYNYSGSTINIDNCSIHHNTTDGDGGGISNYEQVHDTFSPLLSITNSTICYNTSAGAGGGISGYSEAVSLPGNRIYLTNATISENESSTNGGGVYAGPYSSFYIINTIVANNIAATKDANDVYYSGEYIEDNGYNIIEDYIGHDFSSNETNYTGEQTNLNLSSTLELNHTLRGTYTLSITSGSIARDNGTNTDVSEHQISNTDQRYAPRNDEVDIGAYEWWDNTGNFPVEPAEHVSNFTATAMFDVTIDLSWTENDGENAADGYLILASTGGISPPDDDTSPVDDTDLTDGEGNVMVPHGTTSYTFNNCSSSTTYNFRIYPYTDSYDYINYKTDSGYGYDDATIGKPEPSNHVTVFTASTNMGNPLNQIDNSWTDASGGQLPDSYLIKANDSGYGDISDPVDGTPEDDDTDFSDGSGTINIAHGSKGSYSWTTLNEGTVYYFKIYPYTNTGSLINYKTDDTVPAASATTYSVPETSDLIITEIVGNNVNPMNPNTGFIEFLNISGTLIDLSSVQVNYYDDGAGAPTANMALFGGIGIGEYKIICQHYSNFMMFYGFDADFQAPYDWGTNSSEFPLDGGADVVEIILPDKRATIDRFNDPADPFTWSGEEPLERTSTSDGGDETSWTENTGGTGTPGEDGDNPLAITLSSFTVLFVDEQPLLQWKTQSENNNAGWNIYRGETEEALEAAETEVVNFELIPGAGNSSEPISYEYSDLFPLQTEEIYYYWLESVSYSSLTDYYGPVSLQVPDDNQSGTPEIPLKYSLQNYPNPFNPETIIALVIPQSGSVKLDIYNLHGQKMTTLIEQELKEGSHRFIWNGKDDNNNKVGSGIYFYRLLLDGQTKATSKCLLLK